MGKYASKIRKNLKRSFNECAWVFVLTTNKLRLFTAVAKTVHDGWGFIMI